MSEKDIITMNGEELRRVSIINPAIEKVVIQKELGSWEVFLYILIEI